MGGQFTFRKQTKKVKVKVLFKQRHTYVHVRKSTNQRLLWQKRSRHIATESGISLEVIMRWRRPIKLNKFIYIFENTNEIASRGNMARPN